MQRAGRLASPNAQRVAPRGGSSGARARLRCQSRVVLVAFYTLAGALLYV